MDDAHGPANVDAISSLGDANRRALYDFVVEHGDWTSRDQAAKATGIERATAAHHLDRLASDGLLETDYRRLTGRTGPGAGRPAKVYMRARRDIAVSLPPRDYELAGRMLAAAADRARRHGTEIQDAIDTEARHVGRRLGEEIAELLRGSRRARTGAAVQLAIDRLAVHGYEPERDDRGIIVLRNCPFHTLAQEHTDLICGMNLCLLTEALGHLDAVGLQARLEPEEGQCCVKLHPSA